MNPKSTKLYYALTQNNPETNNNNKCSVNTTHSKSKYNTKSYSPYSNRK